MFIFGVDAHKRTHTIVAVDERGKPHGQLTIAATTEGHLDGLSWAQRDHPDRLWAIEDCRNLSRRLESDLLAAGERVVRVPPKLMAGVRNSARTFGKSDPIDALAVARAALREPDLPVAHLDGPARTVRLLADHREHLVEERTRAICRLRWHLHELDPALEPPARKLNRVCHYNRLEPRLDGYGGLVARLARNELARCRQLTIEINELEKELAVIVRQLAPTLLALHGCAVLNAAKIIGQTAGIERFKSRDAYARYNGTAPIPVWSSNTSRHRLSRIGNRQLNAALHRIAITQLRVHPPARQLYDRHSDSGRQSKAGLRVVKRRISDAVYQALRADLAQELELAA